MKTRHDFVSNSSSCSFMISNLAASLSKLKDWYVSFFPEGYASYEIDDLEVSIHAKRSILREMHLELNKSFYYDNFTSRPDEVDSAEFHFYDIVQLSESLINQAECIYVRTDDSSNSEKLYLSLLFMLLKDSGVDVDCSVSEMPLLFQEDDDSILGKLLKAVMHKKKEETL